MGNSKGDIPVITIVGAGFSGISLAANLYQFATSPLHIILIGSPELFGKGIAYSTKNLLHLLNVRVKDMSAFSHDDDHFLNWLLSRAINNDLPADPLLLKDQFVPRYLYSLYLEDILLSISKPSPSGCYIEFIKEEAVSVLESDQKLGITLRSGRLLNTDKLILAHGCLLPDCHFKLDESVRVLNNPWDYQSYQQIATTTNVLIVGTGLTMIDAVIQLKSQHHQGMIYTLSRRGLTPKAQTNNIVSYQLDDKSCTMGLMKLVRFIKSEIHQSSGDIAIQQAIFRAVRLKANDIWHSFTLFEKKQFLRHLQPYWEVQRHRTPPQIDQYFKELQTDGVLELIKGRLREVKNNRAMVKLRYPNKSKALEIDWLINCTGPGYYTQETRNPLIQSLLSQEMATVNELGLGLNVSSVGALINTSNVVSDRLYVLGPPLKGVLFECTAVREIKEQSIRLAMTLLMNRYKQEINDDRKFGV